MPYESNDSRSAPGNVTPTVYPLALPDEVMWRPGWRPDLKGYVWYCDDGTPLFAPDDRHIPWAQWCVFLSLNLTKESAGVPLSDVA